MGRHRSPESHSGIAKELIYGVIAVIVVIVLLVAWFMLRNRTAEQHQGVAECPAGQLSISTAALHGTQALSAMQDEFLDSKPKVQDYCITGFNNTDLSNASLIYTEESDATTKDALAEAGQSIASSTWPTLALRDVGIAYPSGTPAPEDWTAAQDVAFVTERQLAGALAAQAMNTPNPHVIPQERAIAENKAFVTSGKPPAGYELTVPLQPQVVKLPIRVLATATSPQVSEEQSRAAAEFVKFVSERQAQLSGDDVDKLHAALTAAPMPVTAASEPTDTLIVLDTSEAMGPHYDAVVADLARRARELGEQGKAVGVWNYSSPLSRGATKGWRDNVPLLEGAGSDRAVTALTNFGTGGVPQTHAAVYNALLRAKDFSAETSRPVSVLLVTTGTADAGSVGPLADALRGLDGSAVTLHILHVGDGPEDTELRDWATAHGGSVAQF